MEGLIMQLSVEFWITIVMYAISFGVSAGVILTRLKYIEAKQDKHNNFITRLTINEQCSQSAQRRIDELKIDLDKIKDKL